MARTSSSHAKKYGAGRRILIILGAALGFTNYLIDAEVPMKLFNLFKAYTDSPFVFLIY